MDDSYTPRNDRAALRALEQNVIMRFSSAVHTRFAGTPFADTTLGSQDQIFADYLLAANARFALVEFKASFLDVRSEAKKPLRRALFDQLAIRDDFLRRCLDFHYICWGTTNSLEVTGRPQPMIEETECLNHYALQVAPFMLTKPRLRTVDDYSTSSFLDGFLGARLVGGRIDRFKTYVNELGALAGGTQGDASNIEGMVFTFIPGSAQSPARFAHIRFKGLDQLALSLASKPPVLEHQRQHHHELEADRARKPDHGMRM